MRDSDAHWALLGARSGRIAAAAIRVLEKHKCRYVTGGGWAVFAHDPVTPSADYDAFLPNGFPKPVRDELTNAGFRIGPREEIEALELDRPNELLGSGDPDLGVPLRSFVPANVFEGKLVRKEVTIDMETLETAVPAPPALAITKLAALRARSIGFSMFEDGAVLALLDPSTATMMRALPQSYYFRKAGKDLFDISLLLSSSNRIRDCRRLAEKNGVWDALIERLPETPPLLLRMAKDLARRVDRPDPSFVLRIDSP